MSRSTHPRLVAATCLVSGALAAGCHEVAPPDPVPRASEVRTLRSDLDKLAKPDSADGQMEPAEEAEKTGK